MAESRVIKRYANRKMYDTARSCYVTLEEVADMVREGYDVRVLDNRTKDDLTEVTLTQALLDTERRKRGSVPLSGLRHLISSGNEFLSRRVAEPVTRVREGAERVREGAERTVATWKDEAGRTVTAWKSEAEKRADELTHRIDERVHHAITALARPTHEPDPGVETKAAEPNAAETVASLRTRVETLEARVAALEADAKARNESPR